MSKSYNEIAEEGYVGLTDPELHLMAKEIGVKVHPSAKGALVKEKINAYLGIGTAEPEAEAPKPKSNVSNISKRLDNMPSLSGDGKWGGRMHIVRISRQSDDPPSMTHYLITWEGMTVKIPLDEPFHVPAPHYYRLRDNFREDIRDIEKQRDDGEKYIEHVTTRSRVRSFDDLGVVPETAHLPDGKKSFLQDQARKHNNFLKFKRQDLMRIHGILRNTSVVNLRDVSDEDIRMEILETLGPEFMEREEDAA
mgnify:CR=1 FL=1